MRVVCVHRLWRDHGLSWHALEPMLSKTAPAKMAVTPRPEGRGRPPGERARFVWTLERYDLIGAAGGPKGAACSKAELALIWLLLFGIEDLSAARIRRGMTADDVIALETNTMHTLQSSERHGYPDMGMGRKPRGHRRSG